MAKRIYDGPCPIGATLAIFGGKWKPAILHWVKDGPKRFNELRRLIPTITQRMLTQQLRELESCGLVSRTHYPEIPPRVEYSMTELGKTLTPVFAQLQQWGEVHLPTIRSNQSRSQAAG